MLGAESAALELLHGEAKVVESYHRQEGSVTGHAQRNKGLELTQGLEGLVYFVDGDNVIHPHFWALLTTEFTQPGERFCSFSCSLNDAKITHANPAGPHIYTFNMWLRPVATVFVGNWVEPWHIDTAMYAIDRRLIGDTRCVWRMQCQDQTMTSPSPSHLRFEISMYEADGIFVSEIFNSNEAAHVFIDQIAAFYNFSKQRFLSLLPQLAQHSWTLVGRDRGI